MQTQKSHNSFNVRRPKDVLERTTKQPKHSLCKSEIKSIKNDQDLNDYFDDFVSNMQCILEKLILIS